MRVLKAVILISSLVVVTRAMAMGFQATPDIPPFPVLLATILSAIGMTVTQFLKSRLPDNGLVKLAVAAGLSVVIGVVGALIAGVDLGLQDGAYFVSVVFAYSQIGWNVFKNIRELGK